MKIKNYLYILPLLSLLGSCSNPNYSYSFSINDVNKANINRNLDINGTSYETGLVYEDGKMNRHEGVRIGEEVYITRGISENIIRSRSNPKECTLSVNGLFFSDRNGNPFSLVLNTMDLQD